MTAYLLYISSNARLACSVGIGISFIPILLGGLLWIIAISERAACLEKCGKHMLLAGSIGLLINVIGFIFLP